MGFPACITVHITSIQGGLPLGEVCIQGEACLQEDWADPLLRKAGATHPTGMLSFLQNVCTVKAFPFNDEINATCEYREFRRKMNNRLPQMCENLGL